MALQKITKRAVKGSLLVQYKFDENEGVWTHGTSSNSYAIVAKNFSYDAQYPNSVIEFNGSFSIGKVANSDNSSDTYSCIFRKRNYRIRTIWFEWITSIW